MADPSTGSLLWRAGGTPGLLPRRAVVATTSEGRRPPTHLLPLRRRNAQASAWLSLGWLALLGHRDPSSEHPVAELIGQFAISRSSSFLSLFLLSTGCVAIPPTQSVLLIACHMRLCLWHQLSQIEWRSHKLSHTAYDISNEAKASSVTLVSTMP